MIKLTGFLLLLAFWVQPTFAQEPAQVLRAKDDWPLNMQNDLPKTLCKDDLYFVKCYQVSASECLEAMELYVKGCLNNTILALPAQLNQEQGEYWGKMVGRCSFDLYEKFMKDKKRQLPECNGKETQK